MERGRVRRGTSGRVLGERDDKKLIAFFCLLPPKSHGAVCLDGSAPGYHYEKGWGTGADGWMIHLQGGGWCVNEQDCVGRSNGALGSSKSFTTDVSFFCLFEPTFSA